MSEDAGVGGVLVVAGTVVVGVGLWLVYPPLAVVALGLALGLLGVGYMRGERREGRR